MAASDILIVGGGVIGTSLAFQLARRRAGRVVLLEKAFTGAGASGKSAAVVRTKDSTPLTTAMARAGLRLYEHFGETVGGPPVFTRTGLVLVAPESGRAALESAASGESAGDGLRLLGARELTEIDPNVRLSEDEVAAIEPGGGYLDAVQVVASLTEAAQRHGADVRQGVEVTAVTAEKGRVTGVETNEGPLACGALVLATGPWAAPLLKPLKVTLPVEGRRSPAALFRRPADAGRRALVLADFVQGLYFRPAQGELVQVGSLVPEEDAAPADPDEYDESAPGSWLPSVRQRLSRRYPALHRAFGRGGFAAVSATTPDGHPIIDRLPGPEGVWCATGFGGNGFLLAPAVGDALAGWVVDGKPAEFDLAPLRLARFEEDDSVKPTWPFGMLG
jgi:glycine/D-amino acid oxidase-like deaminating enzyme